MLGQQVRTLLANSMIAATIAYSGKGEILKERRQEAEYAFVSVLRERFLLLL